MKIIFFELNEVPLKILEYYQSMRPNSWIAQNYNKFKKYETFSENAGHLSPWNTWPTVHRGVSNEKHGISELNQDLTAVNKEHPPIWDILSTNDVTTGVFGSLHSFPLPEEKSNVKFHIPDVFSPLPNTHPTSIELFQKINLNLARKSAKNVDTGIPLKEVVSNLANIAQLGFKMDTIACIGKHLVEEKMDKWKTTRRRTFQSVLSFDVFYKLLVSKKPDFVTFFTNHVASSMHRYWAATFPGEYEKYEFSKEWQETYTNEILYTMDHADKMLAKLSKFVDLNPEYKILISSSMGQEPIESEPLESQLLIVNNELFLNKLGVVDKEDYVILPAMIPQYNYTLVESKKELFKSNLSNLTINGNPVVYRELSNGHFSIDFGQANLETIEVKLNENIISLKEIGMENVEIADKSGASAYHIPEGHLFSYHPSNSDSKLVQNQMLTCDIAPAILNNFGVDTPDYMNKLKFSDL
ncbi:hypothetical protein [uncultured Nonlabens sp.]|jgi:hypothetical protein|uniref:hypothetical protein n=1 Tax=uncultured Nonlabens sp. TaxID=859306 RepID=UPI0030DBBC7E|tara:strand:- start:52560 stop:53966 length:1407 start_codon:yes stop_codon:yes gene_type:complete